MDYSSGLVVLVQDEGEAAVLERELDLDVRVSVHLQDAESFLIDVHAHRFDLIVDLVAEEHAGVVILALGLLRPTGVYLASQPGSLSRESFTQCAPGLSGKPVSLEPDDFEVARLGDPLDSLIIVRRAEPIHRKHRSNSKAG